MSYDAVKLILFGFISTMGSRIFSFACAFYILKYTDNSYLYSLYLTLIVLTTIFSTPIAGVFIDTLNNKRLVFYSQLTSVIILTLFAFLYYDHIYLIIVIGVLLVIPDDINSIIIQKNLQKIVTKDFERIISIRQTVSTITSLITPILGGLIIAVMPLQLIGTINIFTEVISIFLLQSLPILNHKQSKNKFSTLFNEGLQYLLKKKNLFIVLCTAIFVNFLSNSIIVGVPIIAVQQLKLTSTQFGMIEAAYTISIFLVSFILSIYPLKKDLKKYFKMSILLQFFAIFALGGFLLFPHSHMISFLFLAGVYFMIGSAMPLSNTSYFIYLQNVIEDEFKGRVFSLNQSIAQSIIPISLAFFGVILNHNAGMVFLIVSSLILLVLLIFSFLVRNYEFE